MLLFSTPHQYLNAMSLGQPLGAEKANKTPSLRMGTGEEPPKCPDPAHRSVTVISFFITSSNLLLKWTNDKSDII